MSKNDTSHILGEEDYKSLPQYNPDLPPLSGFILGMFKPNDPRRTLREIISRSRSSRSTIKKRIAELIRAGLLRKHGKGKATWYTL